MIYDNNNKMRNMHLHYAVSRFSFVTLFHFQGRNHVWKWFDDRVGRWLTYSAGNNKTIDDAYHAGESVAEYVQHSCLLHRGFYYSSGEFCKNSCF